ncbi:hypothetical protein RP20_CCG021903 [Aedes albopictus]|nr:hypothetical protein RP20_CCG021903 [Aedes albopictus]
MILSNVIKLSQHQAPPPTTTSSVPRPPQDPQLSQLIVPRHAAAVDSRVDLNANNSSDPVAAAAALGTDDCGEEMTPSWSNLLHKEMSVSSLDLSSYDGTQSPGSGGTLTPNCRTKRMRTSFKHHQLRTMKSYFAINQNPDAKDLKQLAQKTGLSKRVLQVWFQNARAKWRRNVMRQDGGLVNPGQPLGGLPSITTASLHHHHHHLTSANPSNNNSSDGDMSSSQALEEMHNMTFAELY